MAAQRKAVNLFAYGSLKNPAFIESITGETHEGEQAVLHGYKKFYTHIGFPFIVPYPQGRVHGKCYFGVSQEALRKIDRFECEGTLYDRKEVTVTIRGRQVPAHAYVANIIHIRRTFGVNMDLALVEKAERFIEQHVGERIKIIMTPPGEVTSKGELVDMTRHELFGAEISNLLNMFLLDKYVSNYTIDSHLKIHGMPTLRRVRENPSCHPYAPNYLRMVMCHIVLNQLEYYFRHAFRSELFMRMPYCRFTLSMLCALTLFNHHKEELYGLMEEGDLLNRFDEKDYWDYAVRAVEIGNRLFHEHSREVSVIVREVLAATQHGHIPLGAEMEFSDAGYLATREERPEDPTFDHFKYFLDFDLERRTWKLGGHVDDHTMSPSAEKTRGGFLEFSLGRTDLFEKHSRPATDNPWVLAALIRELVEFTPVKPHSLHIAVQDIEARPVRAENDPEMLICLLLLGGDFAHSPDTGLVEKRVYHKETMDQWGTLHFLRENYHSLYGLSEDARPLRVLEYQFPRLRPGYDYEPLIVAIKGFDVGYRPRPMTSVSTSKYLEPARPEVEYLEKWASRVEPVGETALYSFLAYVEAGLEQEKKGRRFHSKHYIGNMLLKIEKELLLRNDWIRRARRSTSS